MTLRPLKLQIGEKVLKPMKFGPKALVFIYPHPFPKKGGVSKINRHTVLIWKRVHRLWKHRFLGAPRRPRQHYGQFQSYWQIHRSRNLSTVALSSSVNWARILADTILYCHLIYEANSSSNPTSSMRKQVSHICVTCRVPNLCRCCVASRANVSMQRPAQSNSLDRMCT